MKITVSQFFEFVRKSNLLDAAAIRKFETEHGDLLSQGDPAAVAGKLVGQKYITMFQAKQLLAGKYRGFHIGPYKILQPIGSGGMGVVYLGEHTALNRRVALKVLPGDKAKDISMVERFNREARAAAALDHPNIVRVHDIGHDANLHYIVMEYVDGTTLHDMMVKNGPFDHGAAANYASQTAAGLYHAHQKGFIHRDIKPSNLMVDRSGIVRILDMGLTRSFDSDKDNLTKQFDENAIVGTIDIIAPEQAMNLPVDHRSDIYSLGVTMFMLLSGKPPFEGSTTQKLVQHQMREAPSLASIRSSIPPEMSRVVVKMMAKNPADRFQNMKEVIEALGPWMPADAPSLALDEVLPPRDLSECSPTEVRSLGRTMTKRIDLAKSNSSEHASKSRNWIMAGALLGLLTLGGSLWQFGLLGFAPAEEVASNNSKLPSVPKNSKDEKKSTTTKSSNKSLPPKVETKAEVKAGPTKPMRVSAPYKLGGVDGIPERLAVRDDREVAMIGMENGNAGIWDLKQRKLLNKLDGHRGKVRSGSFSPDGNRIAIIDSSGLLILWDWQNAREVWRNVQPGMTGWSCTYTPDGRHVLATFHADKLDGKVQLLDAKTGEVLRTKAIQGCESIAACPDNRTAVLGLKAPNEVMVWDYQFDTANRSWPMKEQVRAVAVSPDGQTIVAAGGNQWSKTGSGFLSLIDFSSGQLKTKFEGDREAGTFNFVRFSPNGEQIVATGFSRAARVWDVITGKQAQTYEHMNSTTYLGAADFLEGGLGVITCGRDGSTFIWPLVEDKIARKPNRSPTFQPISLADFATANSLQKMFSQSKDVEIDFEDWGPRSYDGVPYQLLNPADGKPNIILMHGGQGDLPPSMPTSLKIPVNSSAKAIHFLGAVSGWGWPYAPPGQKAGSSKGQLTMSVRLVYADGRSEEVFWKNGEQIANYHHPAEVPGSKFATLVKYNRQVHTIFIEPTRSEIVKEIELLKGPDDNMTAPMVFAITLEK